MVSVVYKIRAISRVLVASLACRTFLRRSTSRCSVVPARSLASSSSRAFGFSRTSIAFRIIPVLNHATKKRDSANATQSLVKLGTSYPGGIFRCLIIAI